MPDPQVPLYNASINPSITVNRSQADQGIYVQIDGDSRFPAVSAITVVDYPDNTQAFIPSDKKLGSTPSYTPPLTTVVVYPKFATLQYVINSSDFILGQGGFVSLTAGTSAYGTFAAIKLINATTFNSLTATGSNVAGLTGVSIPVTADIIYGPFTGVAVSAGGPAIVYYA